MQIINGTEIANEIKTRLKNELEKEKISPSIAIILLGEDKQDFTYVELKRKAAESIGGKAHIYKLPAETEKEDLLGIIDMLNKDINIHGILLQLPLPERLKIHTEEFLEKIDRAKDIDGFNPINRGLLTSGNPNFISCAALAAIDIINRFHPVLENQQAVLLGDSFDLIIPLAVILAKRGCKANIIPEYDSQLVKFGDILVLEKGAAGIVQKEDIKEGALIIDAGFHWEIDRICGNVEKDAVKDIDGFLLPVPGGIGPLLIAKLMENLCSAAKRNR